MYCSHCGKKAFDGAQYCSNCGNNVSNRIPAPEAADIMPAKKESKPGISAIKRISQFLSIILFIFAWGGVSSFSPKGSGWLVDFINILKIANFVTIIALLADWWQNRKSGKAWFTWRWITFLLIISILGLGSAIFFQAIITAKEKAITAKQLEAKDLAAYQDAVAHLDEEKALAEQCNAEKQKEAANKQVPESPACREAKLGYNSCMEYGTKATCLYLHDYETACAYPKPFVLDRYEVCYEKVIGLEYTITTYEANHPQDPNNTASSTQ